MTEGAAETRRGRRRERRMSVIRLDATRISQPRQDSRAFPAPDDRGEDLRRGFAQQVLDAGPPAHSCGA
jgi:hypothetical protein